MKTANLKFNELNQEKFLKWFFILSVFFMAIAVVLMCTLANHLITWNIWSDFAEVMCYCIEKNPYDGSSYPTSIYPPIAFLFLYPFALMCKGEAQRCIAGEITHYEMAKQPICVVAQILYIAINMAIIVYISAKLTKFKGKKLFYLIAIILLWGPCLYCYHRANTIMTTAVFVMLFFVFYKSEKRWQCELSLLFLAFAISIKIYPVLIALVFIKDRRWLDLFKTAIYTMLLVFVPFAFYSGGFIYNIKCLLKNFTVANNSLITGGSNVSLSSLLYKIQLIMPFIPLKVVEIASLVLKIALICCSVVVMFFAKNSKKDFNILWIVLITYILSADISIGYILVVTIVPFIYFIINFDKFSVKARWIYSLIYVLMYCQIFYGVKNNVPQQILLIALYVYYVVDIFKEFRRNRQEQKRVNQ